MKAEKNLNSIVKNNTKIYSIFHIFKNNILNIKPLMNYRATIKYRTIQCESTCFGKEIFIFI